MRILFLSAALVLIPALSASGADKLIISRTLQLDFKNPGKIAGINSSGFTTLLTIPMR